MLYTIFLDLFETLFYIIKENYNTFKRQRVDIKLITHQLIGSKN